MAQYNTLVNSLKRLYRDNKVTIGKLNTMLSTNAITSEEFSFIVND